MQVVGNDCGKQATMTAADIDDLAAGRKVMGLRRFLMAAFRIQRHHRLREQD